LANSLRTPLFFVVVVSVPGFNGFGNYTLLPLLLIWWVGWGGRRCCCAIFDDWQVDDALPCAFLLTIVAEHWLLLLQASEKNVWAREEI
jgi:hypothetical protein